MMNRIFISILAMILQINTSSISRAAEGFSFDMPDPRLRITIPDLPQVTMDVHPSIQTQPHMRFLGREDTGLNVSILVSTADEGMTAQDCARAHVKHTIALLNLDPQFVNVKQTNATTFVMLFPRHTDPITQLHAYVISSHPGHCMHVHASKILMPVPDAALATLVDAWYQGFQQASIVSY